MKAIIILSSISFFINAMDNNNNSKSYLTYESSEDKGDACILHVPKSKFEEEAPQGMTFVHKKGIPIEEDSAINFSYFLDTHKPTLLKQIETATLHFLRNIVQFDTMNPHSSVSQKLSFSSLSFKKPQVRIIKKSEVNCEEMGIFGPYVDTNFLQIKTAGTYSISKQYQRISVWCYVAGKKDQLTIIPYKVYLPDYNNIYVRAEKEVHYF